MARKLTLKKEILAELTADELRAVVAGDVQVISQNARVCQAISLDPLGTCSPTCGDGCTNRSTIVKG
jgi:hypothetical protein